MPSLLEQVTWLKSMGLKETGANLLLAQALTEQMGHNLLEFKRKFQKDQRVLFMECYPTHLLAISVNATRLASRLTVIGFRKSIPKLATLISGAMTAVGLVENEAAKSAIEGFALRDMLAQPVIDELLSAGIPAIQAKSSDVKLLVKPYSGQPQYNESISGQIDYHDLHLFQNVLQNQAVGLLIPPVAGAPGRDVFGDLIPGGEPKHQPVQCGHGVLLDDRAGQFIATRPGYLVFEDRKLKMEETYVVEGDVNLNVGHINFVSDVHIRGDVLPDFSVQAGGSIEVAGTVTGATIQCEKDLSLRLGVLGQQGKSFIKIGGDIRSKFLNECKVEVEGSLHLQNEALNSMIYCMNQIRAETAVIIGGRIVCLKEISLGAVGSELGIKTQIFLGEDYMNLNQTEEVREAILRKRDRISVLFSRHGKEIDFWQKDRCDTPEGKRIKKDDLDAQLRIFEEVRSEISELILLNQEFSLLSKEPNKNRMPVCLIKKAVYPGVVFFNQGTILEIKEKVTGPVQIRGEVSSSGKASVVLHKVH